jgi:hypothetical protein
MTVDPVDIEIQISKVEDQATKRVLCLLLEAIEALDRRIEKGEDD